MRHSVLNNKPVSVIVTVSILFGAAVAMSDASIHSFTLTAKETAILPVPLSLDLEGVSIPETHNPRLYRIDGDQQIPLAVQMDAGRTARLWFIPDRTIGQGQSVRLELAIEASSTPSTTLTAAVDDRTITLGDRDRPILRYHHAEHPVPEGVNSIFQRSGFIHPLYTPDGMVVTRIQPPDHYHHYGIWSPWTKTVIDGREVDFWNLGQGQGRVRFAGLLSTVSGPVFAGFKAHQEHVITGRGDAADKVAMNEVWDIRASSIRLDGRTVWVVDYTSTLNNALESPIELSAYRYGGGLGFRATDDWNKENLVVLTSEGKTRNEADGTRARWADVRGIGRNKTGSAGVLFLSHSGNREHPEPMRTWDDGADGGRGLMFFEFCPIRHESWTLMPHRDYVLRYRMVVYDGQLTPETAEMLWTHYTHPPVPVSTP